MERTCSQTIKIPFPVRIFYGTEVTVDIPRSGGEILKNIKLVLDFSTRTNTLGSTIVERAEVLVDDEMTQITYGEFIQVENILNTPAEKYDKLLQLMCISTTGTMYMSIPFEDVYLNEHSKTQIRLLFSSDLKGELSDGYLLADYYLYENPPKFPFVQKTTQIQKFSRIVNSPKSLKMSVYAVGPVYQLYFTVKDTTTGSYIDALTNVTLNFGEKERFNLTGKYLRYVEPLKRINTYAAEPVYMYNFCLNPGVTSGATHFPDNSIFVLDFYDNSSTYEVTIWAKSHDFLYTTEKTTKRIFESTEMLLDTTTSTSSLQDAPLRVSYINYSGSIVVFYSSTYEVSNVNVSSSLSSIVTQNTIEFNRNVDSILGEYTANVVFSFQGFRDITCYFRFRGYSTYLDNIVYTSEGNYPTHIDLGQNFHYLLGNVFDFSNVIFTSNIQTLSVDELKNYAFTTYTTGTSNILGSGTSFTGPGSILAKYDENMNLLFTVTTQNSNITLLSSSNTYGLSFAQSGTVVSRDLGYSYTASAGNASVFVDSVTPSYSSIRFGISSSNILANSITTNFGNGTDRVALVSASSTSPLIVSNIRQVKTALETFSNGQPVWSFMYSSSSASSSSSVTVPASSNGYLVWSQGWSKTITNVTSSNFDSMLLVDRMTDAVYLVAGYTSTTPALTSFTFAAGTGFFVVKFDRSGNTKYVVSFIGSGILGFSPMVDSTTGRFMISVTSQLANLLNIYNSSGTLINSTPGKYQFFVFDDFGSITSSNKDFSELFALQKPNYFTPLCSSKFFDQNVNDAPLNKFWSCFSAGTISSNFSRAATDSVGDVYVLNSLTSFSGFSNIFDKYGDSKIRFQNVNGPSTIFLLKFNSNCTYKTKFALITNVKHNNDIILNWIFTKGTSVYILVTTNSTGTVSVLDINNNQVITITPTSESLLFVKFNTDGTYANWYALVSNSLSNSITGDSNGNLYVTGIKNVTASQNINITTPSGTVLVGTIPVTVFSYTAFVIKFSSTDVYQWNAYVDGHAATNPVSAAGTSSGNVYLSGTRISGTTARINGSTSNIISSSTYDAAYIVKFDSNGNYGLWHAHVTSTLQRSESKQVLITSINEPVWLLQLGDFNPWANQTFSLYIKNSGTSSANFTSLRQVCSALLKFSTADGYLWNVRSGMDPDSPNNYSYPKDFSIDRLDNFILTTNRQSYALFIYDKNNSLTIVPAAAFESGVTYKINSDGTVTNGTYVYIDTTADDNLNFSTIDRNGDIFIGGFANKQNSVNTNTRYFSFFDGLGYEGITDVVYNQTSYGFILKCNANFTFNKISL